MWHQTKEIWRKIVTGSWDSTSYRKKRDFYTSTKTGSSPAKGELMTKFYISIRLKWCRNSVRVNCYLGHLTTWGIKGWIRFYQSILNVLNGLEWKKSGDGLSVMSTSKDPRNLKFPLQSMESSEFSEVFQIDHQKICLTDSGSNHVLVMIIGGEHTKELMRRSQVAHVRSTTYHPQTKGLVERQNRTMVSILRVYCSRYMTDWVRFLQQMMVAYNSTQHSARGISPHMMFTFIFLSWVWGQEDITTGEDLIRSQQELNDLCRRKTQQAQAWQKKFDNSQWECNGSYNRCSGG